MHDLILSGTNISVTIRSMDDTYPMLIRLGFLPSLLQCPHKSQCHSSSNWLLLSPLVGTVTHNEREAPILPVFKRGKKKQTINCTYNYCRATCECVVKLYIVFRFKGKL